MKNTIPYKCSHLLPDIAESEIQHYGTPCHTLRAKKKFLVDQDTVLQDWTAERRNVLT